LAFIFQHRVVMFKARSLYPLVTVLAFTGGVAVSASMQTAPAPDPASETPHVSLAIIVNNENPLSQLPIGELRRMMLGEVTRWPDGRRVTIAMREPGRPERDAVLRLICRMSDQDFSRYLLQATFRGELQGGPKILDTANGVRRFVFNVPGAIGYLRSDEVDGSVKILQIAGAVPGNAAFGLTLRSK
jgi:ABC-type phosphate transport system substrate-binding protein